MEIIDKEDYELYKEAEENKNLGATFLATEYTDRKKYEKASLYFLKSYLGIPELVIYLLFVAFAVTYACLFTNFLPLVFVGVVTVLVGFTILISFLTTRSGFKFEYVMREIAYQKLTFSAERLLVESYKKGCEKLYDEEFLVTKINKIAVLKNVVYIYPATGIVYYVERDSLEGDTFENFVKFLHEVFPETTFKLRKKIKMYPTVRR